MYIFIIFIFFIYFGFTFLNDKNILISYSKAEYILDYIDAEKSNFELISKLIIITHTVITYNST